MTARSWEPGIVDLLLKGGRVTDPASGTDRIADVAFAAGRVAVVDAALTREIVDVAGGMSRQS